MREIKKTICIILIFVCIFSSNLVVFATEDNAAKIEGKIDADIYEMVEEYKDGKYTSENKNVSEARAVFGIIGIGEEENDNVNYLYDNKQISSDTYEATQVAMYSSSLEQESQDAENGVIIFCRIVYEKKNFDDSWDYVMLKKVKGGVVQNNGNYWCEYLRFRYKVVGDAYDANGVRQGFKGVSTEYNAPVSSPVVGTSYYIDGPNDYYYCMGSTGSVIAGFVKGTISYRLGNSTTLEVSSAVEAI